MSKLISVYCPYFDGDHDHGSYNIGPFTSVETAKEAAEILANHLYGFGKWEWVRPEGSLPHIEANEGGWEYGMNTVSLLYENVNPTVTSENVSKFLDITYT